MSTATQGRRREYHVRDTLEAAGWPFVMRAAASKGPGDLLHGHPVHGGLLVQVGTPSKSLGPADRERFVTAADNICAIPVLAVVHRGGDIKWWHVTRDKPATWQTFTP